MTPEEQAAFDAEQDKQIRELAAQIGRVSALGFDPMTIRKGIVSAVSDSTSPPTVSLNISGDVDTLVAQVRTLNNYTPLAGQTVLVAKQGTEIFLLGAISVNSPYTVGGAATSDNGWVQATITNGSHNGNSNGNIFYRRILDHGSWKMQWRGGWAPGGATTLIASGDALDTDFRPSELRTVSATRDSVGQNVVKLDFQINGTVTMSGGTTGTGSTSPSGSSDFVDPGGYDSFVLSGYLSQAGSDLGHQHYMSAGHSHSISVSSHSHPTAAPAWVSLHGVEYFL